MKLRKLIKAKRRAGAYRYQPSPGTHRAGATFGRRRKRRWLR